MCSCRCLRSEQRRHPIRMLCAWTFVLFHILKARVCKYPRKPKPIHTDLQIQNLRSQFACDKVAWRRLLLGSNRAQLDIRSDEQLRRWIAESLQYRLRTHQARSIGGSPGRLRRQREAASLARTHQDTSSNRGTSKESSSCNKPKQHQRQTLKDTPSPKPPINSSTR